MDEIEFKGERPVVMKRLKTPSQPLRYQFTVNNEQIHRRFFEAGFAGDDGATLRFRNDGVPPVEVKWASDTRQCVVTVDDEDNLFFKEEDFDAAVRFVAQDYPCAVILLEAKKRLAY